MIPINHLEIVNYFKTLAKNSKHIESFFRMDLREIKGSFRSKANFPCMVLESHEGDLGKSSRSEAVNQRTFAFTIYENPKREDFEDQNKKLSECETIGLKVIARMRQEGMTPKHLLYNRFKIETVTYMKVGPVFSEKLYGYRFVGSFDGFESLKVNPDDWCDEIDVCH